MTSSLLSSARAELVAGAVIGPHQSHSRPDNLSKIRKLVGGDEGMAFGMSGMTRYSPEQVLGFVAEITGCSADMAAATDEDAIDPDRALAAIVRAAERLAAGARRGAALLVTTGHPTGLLEHNLRVADAYRAAGGVLVWPREGEKLPLGRGRHEVRYLGGVGCLADGASLEHTHSAAAMEALLGSKPWPDLVLGDHGFAGAAIERGIPTIAVMDINDPALAVAAAEGRDVTVIPMDDNRPPRRYEPSWRIFEEVLRREHP